MEAFYQRAVHASKRINGAYLRSNASKCSRRTISSTCQLRAAKASRQPPKKPSKHEPFGYETPSRKSNFPSPNSKSSSSPPRPNPLKNRSIPIVLGSITLFALSGYTAYLYVLFTRPPPTSIPTTAAEQADVSHTYNDIAASFDSHVSFTEKSTGINRLRRELASLAHGDVLEVSIGTGRNLEFYDFDLAAAAAAAAAGGKRRRGRVRSFTAVDKSPEMLEIAHHKFSAMFPGILGVRWVIGDAAQEGVIPPPPSPPVRNVSERSSGGGGLQQQQQQPGTKKKYDTILQTMGLCSVSDPVALLRNLGEHVVEEEGRILLLEHGRGRWKWLNGALDRGAEGHARQFGCWWNRDFTSAIEESGLVVVKVDRPKWWHGGTTWWIELKKPRADSTQCTAGRRSCSQGSGSQEGVVVMKA